MRTRGNKLPDFRLHFNMRASRKEQKTLVPLTSKHAKEGHRIDSVSNILRPAPNISNAGHNNRAKRGRTRLELIPAFGMSDFPPEAQAATVKNEISENFRSTKTKKFSYSSDHSDYEVSCINTI